MSDAVGASVTGVGGLNLYSMRIGTFEGSHFFTWSFENVRAVLIHRGRGELYLYVKAAMDRWGSLILTLTNFKSFCDT